ncbi:hypothetical protein HPB52_000343 [Rhipicephalus sanguineus]|uniref:BEN domain-containing protein n=1 Tax=Rhipicephalus sanguineus TaxID=34632 RepID=A0A9D4Q9B0_RHISA|nr:hypothetical protein HPB52_000343 [Rhipicephalus sanguineus]
MHVLVKWIDEESWDVYPIRDLADAAICFRLVTQENAIETLRGSMVAIKWNADSPPAEAQLLDFGGAKLMERKRSQLVKEAQKGFGGGQAAPVQKKRRLEGACDCEASRKVAELEVQVQELTEKLEAATNKQESCTLLGNAKELVEKLDGMLQAPRATAVVQAERVDIGGGVHVEKVVLSRLHAHCHNLPTKFARGLLKHVFTEDELRGKSLYGRGSNAHKGAPAKEGLDRVRLEAVIGM